MRWLTSFGVVAVILQVHWNCMLLQQAQAEKRNNNAGGSNFAKTNGTHFIANNKALYLNGFNAYWMMYEAGDPSTKDKVTSAFDQASKYGMNIARTWAFLDGPTDRSLQISPGSYDESMFQGLDFVIAEAKRKGIYMILSLVNNYGDYGGKPRYVEWGRERGQNLTTDDDFYTNPLVKQFYKNHIKAVVTRKNTITGIAYKDDPTIFSWELMNEPRSNDTSGSLVQEWVEEMSAYLKSIDNNHLLEIGLEGFYGDSNKQFNPNNYLVGTDFISNNQLPNIDFATIHLYPESWLVNSTDEVQSAFVDMWIQTHVQDSNNVLKKPLVIGEFGKSFKVPGYSLEKRNQYFEKIYDAIYSSVRSGGPFCGGLFWQLLAQGMDNMGDGYQVVLEDSPSTAAIIAQQSQKLSAVA